MKLFLLAASAASVAADSFATDSTPTHIVYNCEKVRQDVDEANDSLGDGVCDPEVNCGPFSYDLGDCWESADDICMDDDSWYTNGRENFRCSTKTGGIRFGRAGSNDDTGQAQFEEWSGPCNCYEECKQQAEEKDMELVAFDKYSGKCRCWSGTCTWDDSLPCRNGGDDYGVGGPNNGGDGSNPDLGNNWRCPSEIYFPIPREDCDGRDITFLWKNLENYIGDGFCDDGTTLNQQYAADNAGLMFNFNCEEHNYDGGDCRLDCHESIYWATNFVNLHAPFEKVDACTHGAPVASTEFTTACDCYTYCADFADADQPFIFDHDDADMCRCFVGDGSNFGAGNDATLATLTDTTFCGLNSDCQIYEPNRERMCPEWGDEDFTLGVYDNGGCYNSSDVGETVVSYDEYTSSQCVDSAMCMENSWSHGACFDCDRFSTDRNADSYCTDDSPYAQISNANLDTLISDGYLEGVQNEDTSTAGDNCACLNYCVSNVVDYYFSQTGTTKGVEDVMEELNVIAAVEFAYATRNDTCACYINCPDISACGTVGGDCSVGETNIVFHSTVADLNTVS